MQDATSIAIALGIVLVMLGVVSLVRRALVRRKASKSGLRMRHWKDDDGDG